MTDRHRWIVDRHEQDHTVIEVDGQGLFDVPRWLLPSGTRGDDILAVTVKRLSKRDPGRDVEL